MVQEELDAIDAASRAINRITRNGRFAEFELTNGIVLSVKTVPPLLLTAVGNEFKFPDPPVVFIEEKGRDEPNPNDPNYVRECSELLDQQNLALNDLILAVGSSCHSVPDGYFKPEEDGWVSQVEFAMRIAGKPIEIEKDDATKRYLQWLRFYALETNVDVALAQSLPYQLAGIREGEIEEVIASFQRDPQRRTDNGSPSEAGRPNGNQSNRSSRRARK